MGIKFFVLNNKSNIYIGETSPMYNYLKSTLDKCHSEVTLVKGFKVSEEFIVTIRNEIETILNLRESNELIHNSNTRLVTRHIFDTELLLNINLAIDKKLYEFIDLYGFLEKNKIVNVIFVTDPFTT